MHFYGLLLTLYFVDHFECISDHDLYSQTLIEYALDLRVYIDAVFCVLNMFTLYFCALNCTCFQSVCLHCILCSELSTVSMLSMH